MKVKTKQKTIEQMLEWLQFILRACVDIGAQDTNCVVALACVSLVYCRFRVYIQFQ